MCLLSKVQVTREHQQITYVYNARVCTPGNYKMIDFFLSVVDEQFYIY
jgi:hypothetical protein